MSDARDRPPRVLLAIGNPERERHLLDVLRETRFVVAGRSLDGPSLVRQALNGEADAVLAAAGLHRLTHESLLSLREAGIPVVFLTGVDQPESHVGLAYLIPALSDGPAVVAALTEAIRRGAVVDSREAMSRDEVPHQHSAGASEVIAIVSGKGAPGTTTIAIGVAAALSQNGNRVVLVDGDLRGGSVGPILDLDPRRGIAGLGISRVDRAEAVVDELQEGPRFAVLAGVERPEATERLTPERATAAIAVLQERFDTVLIDAGETLSGVTSDTGGALIRSAERILLVTTSDLLGLWNARSCLRFLTESLGVPPEAVSAVINKTGGDGQYDGADAERALGVRVLAAVPEDWRGMRRARASQEPITATRGRAAQAVAELASRLAGAEGSIEEGAAEAVPAWRRWRRQPAEGRQ